MGKYLSQSSHHTLGSWGGGTEVRQKGFAMGGGGACCGLEVEDGGGRDRSKKAQN